VAESLGSPDKSRGSPLGVSFFPARLEQRIAFRIVGCDRAQQLITKLFRDWLLSAPGMRLCFEPLQASDEPIIDAPGHERLSSRCFGIVEQAAEKHAQASGLQSRTPFRGDLPKPSYKFVVSCNRLLDHVGRHRIFVSEADADRGDEQ
jgi:hypothetical protein